MFGSRCFQWCISGAVANRTYRVHSSLMLRNRATETVGRSKDWKAGRLGGHPSFPPSSCLVLCTLPVPPLSVFLMNSCTNESNCRKMRSVAKCDTSPSQPLLSQAPSPTFSRYPSPNCWILQHLKHKRDPLQNSA